MKYSDLVKIRLSQIRESLISEGWAYIGCVPMSTYSFRHKNGNRCALIVMRDVIIMTKNGKICKEYPIYCGRNITRDSKPAIPST